MRKSLAFIIVLVVGIGLGGGGMYLVDKLFLAEKPKIIYVERQPDKVGPTIQLGEITANLSGGGIVRTAIVLEGVNDKSTDPIQSKIIFLRDRVYQVLASRTAADINSAEGQAALKLDLLAQLNELTAGNIQQVLFDSFVYSPR